MLTARGRNFCGSFCGKASGSRPVLRSLLSCCGTANRIADRCLVEIANRQSSTNQAQEFEDETLLLAALRRKDPAAYETFVRRFGGRMLATARRYLDSEHDSADAVQDAFLSAVQSLDRFEGNEIGRAYV